MVSYDKVTMQRADSNSAFQCASNTIYEVVDGLDQGDPEFFKTHGYVFVEVGSDTVEIYVNRLDIDALTRATSEFYYQYAS